MDFLSPSTNIMLLRAYMVTSSLIKAVATVVVKLVDRIITTFEERKFYFLEGYSSPYSVKSANIYASSSAEVLFIYNADTKEFRTPMGASHPLPLLSLEIIRDGLVAYDLTDFIEGVTVVSIDETPSISQIVQAWMIDSHIILNRECEFMVRVVSTSGNMYTFDILDTDDILDAIADMDLEENAVPLTTPQGEESEEMAEEQEEGVEEQARVDDGVEEREDIDDGVEEREDIDDGVEEREDIDDGVKEREETVASQEDTAI